MNPLSATCQQDEDTVERTSRLSRRKVWNWPCEGRLKDIFWVVTRYGRMRNWSCEKGVEKGWVKLGMMRDGQDRSHSIDGNLTWWKPKILENRVILKKPGVSATTIKRKVLEAEGMYIYILHIYLYMYIIYLYIYMCNIYIYITYLYIYIHI